MKSMRRSESRAASRWARPILHRTLALAACIVLPAGAARAQLLDRYFPANVPIYQDWFIAANPAPSDSDYSPLGVRLGSFILLPSITEGIGYDSNIFGLAGGAGSPDVLSSGSVSLNSDWSRNSVNAAVSVDDTRYLDFPSRSYTEWTASVGGSVDYAENEIRAGYSHFDTVSLPTQAGLFGLSAPVANTTDDFRVSDSIGPGPLVLVPAVTAQIYQFSPIMGDRPLSLDDLFNRQAITASVTAGYEFAGGHNVIVVLSDSQVGYDSSGLQARPADYNDASILTGIEYRASALFTYRALVGFEERTATGKGTDSATISAPAAELDLIWSPNVLTSVTGQVSQTLQDQPTGIAQGLTETMVDLSVKYALRRNVSLGASIAYTRASFPHSAETQSTITAGASATWNLSRNVALSGNYEFTKGDDSLNAVQRFSRNQVIFQIKFQI